MISPPPPTLLSHEALGVISNAGGPTRLWKGIPAFRSVLQLSAEKRAHTEAQQLPVRGRSGDTKACGVSGFQAVLQRQLPAYCVRPPQRGQRQLSWLLLCFKATSGF